MNHFDKQNLLNWVGKKHQLDDAEPTWTHVFCMFRVFIFPIFLKASIPFMFLGFFFGPPMGLGGWSLSQYARRGEGKAPDLDPWGKIKKSKAPSKVGPRADREKSQHLPFGVPILKAKDGTFGLEGPGRIMG